MNIIPIILILWSIIDIIRYIRYSYLHKKLSNKIVKETNHNNIKILLQDLKTYPDLFESTVDDLFYNKLSLEEMNFEEVCIALFELVDNHEQYKDEIKQLVKYHQILHRKNGRVIFNKIDTYHPKIDSNTKLQSWFIILPIFLLTKISYYLVHFYMRFYLKFNILRLKNGIDIWYNNYDEKKGKPLLFFHASTGGCTILAPSLKRLNEDYNIIMPELPCLSFTSNVDEPLLMSEIVNSVHSFIKQKYTNQSIEQINIAGHSIGTAICCGYINKYPEFIDSFFSIEGQIVFPSSIKISHSFNKTLNELPADQLLTLPFFDRNMIVQYYFLKHITLDVLLFDMNSDDKKHIKLFIYHLKNDVRALIDPQLNYFKRKNISVKYHIFNGNYCHGSFAFNKNIRDYVLNDIKVVYKQKQICNY